MKKFCLSIIAAVSMISTPLAFADTQTTGGYTNGQVNLVNTVKAAKPGLAAAAALTGMLPTNIIIINFSDFYLHARITGLTVDQAINAGAPALFSNRDYRNDSFQILDGNNRDLFGFVALCRRAIVTIDGGPSVFHMNVERKYC